MKDRLRDRSEIVVVGAVVFLLTYVAVQLFHPPLLWYVPLERRFSFGQRPTAIAMDWYGRTLLASLLSLGAGGLAALLRHLAPDGPALRPGVYALGLALSVGIALFVYGVLPWG